MGQPSATRSSRPRCSHQSSATCVYPQPLQQRRRSVNSDSHFSDDCDSPSRTLGLAAKKATRFLWCFNDGNSFSGSLACAAVFSISDVRHTACSIEAFNTSLASAAFTCDVCFALAAASAVTVHRLLLQQQHCDISYVLRAAVSASTFILRLCGSSVFSVSYSHISLLSSTATASYLLPRGSHQIQRSRSDVALLMSPAALRRQLWHSSLSSDQRERRRCTSAAAVVSSDSVASARALQQQQHDGNIDFGICRAAALVVI